MRKDPVQPELRIAVFQRDRGCIAPSLGASDWCQGPLTLDHVKDQPMMGKRAPDDLAHLVALCGYANVAVPSRPTRDAMRDYLARVTA